ncbi:hypothetical protein P3T76_002588 [Phytophthora citrophthora]|uniref:Crinkler effector protein N-terminal domain-containing protein n=1 Tax=Phytophthora citrophthora TaxID=4793 RepID=A0AAD9GVX5_9STRA|nr:hypothetical protein P3T76_002588 [Phytophthora citrophthora]
MELYCALVGVAGTVFSVDIKPGKSVGNLRVAIKNRRRNRLKDVDADDLHLYLAKKQQKKGATPGDGDEKWLKQVEAFDDIDTSDYKYLFPTAKLSEVGLVRGQLGEEVSDQDAAKGLSPVHVVVEISTWQAVPRKTRARSEIDDERLVKRQKASGAKKWEWKEEEPVYHRKGRLFFVNREDAIQKLATFHENNFNRAREECGDSWVIPLVDNVLGIGKSAFGEEYIRGSHQAARSLIDSVVIFFQAKYGVLPQALANLQNVEGEYMDYVDVLANLTYEVGPLFIVIEDIGLAFDNAKLDDFAGREQFISFCKFLQPLFENWRLFFLIAGKASFLNHVARRSTANDGSSPFADQELIKKTRWEQASTKTIQDHLELTEDDMVALSARLYETKFGHPRSLLESHDELLNYEPDVLFKGVDWNGFLSKLWLHREPLGHLIDSALDGTTTDLTECWRDQGGKRISNEAMVSEFGIAWDGNKLAAKLYVPPCIQKAILAAVYPVKELLQKVAPAISNISIDYAGMFEMLCLARFKELLQTKACPQDALPGFFTSEQLFGQCRGVQFAEDTYRIPKTTRKASKIEPPSIGSATAHPDQVVNVMSEIGNLRKRLSGVDLDPSPPASLDVLLSTNAQLARPASETLQDTELTVGLAVKSCDTSSVLSWIKSV